jgi:Rieske Fe-S protein
MPRLAESVLTPDVRWNSIEENASNVPCHLGQFDARLGYVMYGPPQRPLDQIVLQMRAAGQVWATGKSNWKE